jgi:carboxylesterase type B
MPVFEKIVASTDHLLHRIVTSSVRTTIKQASKQAVRISKSMKTLLHKPQPNVYTSLRHLPSKALLHAIAQQYVVFTYVAVEVNPR